MIATTNLIAFVTTIAITVKLDNKEHFDKEQIGVKEPRCMTNCQFTT